jgi:Ca-activated chloride channel family protein
LLYRWLSDITFSYPGFLLLLVIIPVMVYWYLRRENGNVATLIVSSLSALSSTSSWRTISRHGLFLLRLLTISCLIIALSRPQRRFQKDLTSGEGIDIVLCIDISGSMMAQDLLPDRMEAAKKVAIEFVQRRPADRIGVVIFSGESYTLVPLTTDKQILGTQLASIQRGLLEDGTAIGDGLGTSINRLMASSTASRVVILLTDGEDQGGRISPLEAKELAGENGIKVYTIGVGTDGYAPFPVQLPNGQVSRQMQKVNVDEKLLQDIAISTGGRYFRAKDTESLSAIYASIDQLEKSKITVTRIERNTEKFFPFAILSVILLTVELILRYTLFRQFP